MGRHVPGTPPEWEAAHVPHDSRVATGASTAQSREAQPNTSARPQIPQRTSVAEAKCHLMLRACPLYRRLQTSPHMAGRPTPRCPDTLPARRHQY